MVSKRCNSCCVRKQYILQTNVSKCFNTSFSKTRNSHFEAASSIRVTHRHEVISGTDTQTQRQIYIAHTSEARSYAHIYRNLFIFQGFSLHRRASDF